MEPKVSIIIPFKAIDDHVKECIDKCLKLNYTNYDIILLPDKALNRGFLKKSKKIKSIPTGAIHPSEKRNKAILSLNSEFFASIDSDAYPKEDWLKNAIPLFENKKIAAVGGPNLAPNNASIKELAAIDVIYGRLGVQSAYYIKPYIQFKDISECKELASSNLILRASSVKKIKGYKSNLRTGEDSILGNELRKRGYKILYSNKVIVYHHRRPLFRPHLKRIFSQSKDKAIVIKKQFSMKSIIFFIPPLFVLFLLIGFILSILSITILIIYASILFIYFIIVLLESLKSKKTITVLLVLVGIPLTHITYGLGFLEGLFLKKRI